MATALGSGGLQTTAAAASYASGTATVPAVGDLLCASVHVTGNTATDWVLTDDQGGTYTKVLRQVKNGGADFAEFWIRNQLCTTTNPHTLTFSHATGNGTGAMFDVRVVTGMSKTGAAAVRSTGGQDNQAAGGTPAPVLNQAALAANLIITTAFNASNPDGMTAPATFQVGSGRSYNTPTTGQRTTWKNSGFTATTVTWGSTSATAFCSFAVELDTSASYSVSTSDTAGASDAPSRSTVAARGSADTAAASDSTTSAIAKPRSVADSAPASDAVARAAIGSRAIADTALADDAPARSIIDARSISETASVTDSVTRSLLYGRSIADAATAADAVIRAVIAARVLGETATATDAPTRALALARSVAETIAASDAVAHSFSGSRSISDVASALDSLTRHAAQLRSIADSAPASDAVTYVAGAHYTAAIADSVGGSDAVTRSLVLRRAIAEIATALDSVGRSTIAARGIADSAPALDTLTMAVALLRLVADSAPAADLVSYSLAALSGFPGSAAYVPIGHRDRAPVGVVSGVEAGHRSRAGVGHAVPTSPGHRKLTH